MDLKNAVSTKRDKSANLTFEFFGVFPEIPKHSTQGQKYLYFPGLGNGTDHQNIKKKMGEATN